jgi:heme O synthase-like polyprenyltransferase
MWHHLLGRLAATTCENPPNFFGFPTWYQYLPGKVNETVRINGADVTRCEIANFEISHIPFIALALVDIALRIAALVAVGYIIYGGIQFILAQGESDKTKKARQTIINAVIGLVISMFAASIVRFIGTSIGD